MERFDGFDAVGDGEPVAQGAPSGAAASASASVPSPTPTPAGRSASASPSPTPTFAATDRPSRRARRLRWKPGVTRPMMALSALSFTLMVAGVAGYVSAIPAMLYQDDDAAVVPLGAFMWVDGQMQQTVAAQQAAAAPGPVAAHPAGAATATDAASALGIGASASSLGASSLATGAATPAGASSLTRAEQAAAANGQASGSAAASGSGASGSASSGSTSGNSGSGSSSSAGGGSDAGSGGASEPSQPSGPTEAEEAAAHELLVTHLSRVNGYVARLNNAIVAFNNDALTASLEQRYTDYNECAAIDSQTLTDFLTLRNYDLPSGSRWAEQKSNLQRAYIALDRYLTVYYDAWDRNVYYADPSTAYDYWMETIWADQDANGNSVLAAQLNDVLASISL